MKVVISGLIEQFKAKLICPTCGSTILIDINDLRYKDVSGGGKILFTCGFCTADVEVTGQLPCKVEEEVCKKG